jgi:hypothetical protein
METLDVVAELAGVREYVGRMPVQLIRNQENGRLAIRAYNECGNNYTEIDLFDLLNYGLHPDFPPFMSRDRGCFRPPGAVAFLVL